MAQLYLDRNSNRFLSPQGAVRDYGQWLTLDAVFARSTEIDQLSLHPQVEYRRYSGSSSANAADALLEAAFSHKGEKLNYDLEAVYSDRGTLISELETTGIVAAAARQQQATAGFGLTDQITERQSVRVQAAYANVEYPKGESVGLVAYHNTFASLIYNFNYSVADSFSSAVLANQDVAPRYGNDSRSAGMRVGWTHLFSPTARISAAIGANRARLDNEASYGSSWAIQAERSYELTDLSLGLMRDIKPNGLGLLIRRDVLKASAVRHLSPRYEVTLSLLSAQNRNAVAAGIVDDRRYASGVIGLGYHYSPSMLVNAQLRGSAARYPGNSSTNRDANGWQAILMATWTPSPYSISR